MSEVLRMGELVFQQDLDLKALEAICPPAEERGNLFRPFRFDGYAYACDGRRALRVHEMDGPWVAKEVLGPTDEPILRGGSDVPIWEKLKALFDRDPRDYVSWVPHDGSRKSHKTNDCDCGVRCEECSGRGVIECSACLHESECERCDGSGAIYSPSCRECRGRGDWHAYASVRACDHLFAGNYYRWFESFGATDCCFEASSRALFVVGKSQNGVRWSGILMSIKE